MSQPKSDKSSKRGKNQQKPEVAKVVTPERAVEINNVVAQIAAASNSNPATSATSPAVALDVVLDALPEPAPAGQGRRKSRRVTTEMLTSENSSENAS
jgi:ribonuclease E